MEGEIKFSTPEEEIQYLEAKIAEKKREMGGVTPRDIVSEVVREHAQLIPQTTTPAPQAPPPQPQQDELARNVSLLVDEALSKGILDAIAHVRETHNPYLIDAFHDALVERLTKDLQARGVIPQT